jgi:hypothetical protein
MTIAGIWSHSRDTNRDNRMLPMQCQKGSEIARTIKSEITQFQLRFTLSIVKEQRTEKDISLAKEQTSYDDYITICAHFVGSREQISN